MCPTFIKGIVLSEKQPLRNETKIHMEHGVIQSMIQFVKELHITGHCN